MLCKSCKSSMRVGHLLIYLYFYILRCVVKQWVPLEHQTFNNVQFITQLFMLYKFDCSNAALLCWAGELFNHFIFLSTINLEFVNKDNDSQVTFGEIMVSLFLVIIHQIIIIFTIIMSVNINRERVMLQSNIIIQSLTTFNLDPPTYWLVHSTPIIHVSSNFYWQSPGVSYLAGRGGRGALGIPDLV